MIPFLPWPCMKRCTSRMDRMDRRIELDGIPLEIAGAALQLCISPSLLQHTSPADGASLASCERKRSHISRHQSTIQLSTPDCLAQSRQGFLLSPPYSGQPPPTCITFSTASSRRLHDRQMSRKDGIIYISTRLVCSPAPTVLCSSSLSRTASSFNGDIGAYTHSPRSSMIQC